MSDSTFPAIIPGDPVRWLAEGVGSRTGILVRFIPPGTVPALPDGVGRRKMRFRPSSSQAARALVREDGTGLYYAPQRESVSPLVRRIVA